MGQFSWFTNDGVRILDNRQLLKPVYMTGKMPDGTIKTFKEEEEYDGYGNFGGKDYFVFMAEMNGFTADDFGGNTDKLRTKGIELAFDGDPHGEKAPHLYPSLSLDGRWYDGVSPKSDPDQGWGVTRKDVEDGLYDVDKYDIDDYEDDDDDTYYCPSCGAALGQGDYEYDYDTGRLVVCCCPNCGCSGEPVF